MSVLEGETLSSTTRLKGYKKKKIKTFFFLKSPPKEWSYLCTIRCCFFTRYFALVELLSFFFFYAACAVCPPNEGYGAAHACIAGLAVQKKVYKKKEKKKKNIQ